MLRLIDLIRIAGIDLQDYKIHCATDSKSSGWRPLEQYFAGNFEDGQAHQNQKNFECDHVLSLINLGTSKRWLFVGVYSVLGVKAARHFNGFIYDLRRLPGLEHLDGRAIIDFSKQFRASYLVGSRHEQNLIIESILEKRMTIGEFPGFNGVCIKFGVLQSIIQQDNASWRAGLRNVSGVYLIVDTSTGYQYVGSAYGGVGIWQRWANYVKTGHGGNKELKQLLAEKGKDHANEFQFSLLEVCDINANPEYVIGRECHWKNVLRSREFGLNWN
jgi:hypothetical protein